MYYKIDNYNDYLMHHGVEGQKHGIRNGPPYPLKQAFAKTAAAYKAHQQKVAAKKRKKILNDPKKLYEHKEDFSEEEIRKATSKAQAVEELKKQIPKNPKKVREKKKRSIDFAKLSMVDTPSKFVKNQKYLTPDERKEVMDYLKDRSQAVKYQEDEKKNLFNNAYTVSQLIGNLGSILTGSFSIVDAFASRDPNKLTVRERHTLNLYNRFYNSDPDLYRALTSAKKDNGKKGKGK